MNHVIDYKMRKSLGCTCLYPTYAMHYMYIIRSCAIFLIIEVKVLSLISSKMATHRPTNQIALMIGLLILGICALGASGTGKIF